MPYSVIKTLIKFVFTIFLVTKWATFQVVAITFETTHASVCRSFFKVRIQFLEKRIRVVYTLIPVSLQIEWDGCAWVGVFHRLRSFTFQKQKKNTYTFLIRLKFKDTSSKILVNNNLHPLTQLNH